VDADGRVSKAERRVSRMIMWMSDETFQMA
jgi:hypothetical protein